MNEVLTIRAHARQSVDALDLHGIAPVNPFALDSDEGKDWTRIFYDYCVEKEKQA